MLVTLPSAQSDKAEEARTGGLGGPTGFGKGQCSLNCVKASQGVREATKQGETESNGDSSPGLSPEVGGFTHEARE